MSLAILVILGFVTISIHMAFPPKLHKYEVIFTWMLSIFLYENFMSLLIMNYKWIKPSTAGHDMLALAIQQLLIIPLLTSWCMSLVYKVKRVIPIFLFISLFSFLLMGSELLVVKLKVIKYLNWHALSSFIVIYCILLFIALLLFFYRKILQQEAEFSYK